MATIYSRTVTVAIPDIDREATVINAAIEVLEAAGFVATEVVVEQDERLGVVRRVARIHTMERHLLPGGVIYPVSDGGQYSIAYVRFTGNSSDAEVVRINGRVYEFDTGGAVAVGSVPVDISGGASAAQSATALALAITTDAGAVVDALVDVSGVAVTLVAKAAITAFTLTETLANGVVSGATFSVGVVAGNRYVAARTHLVSAADVLAWAAGCEVPILCLPNPGSAPQQTTVQARSGPAAVPPNSFYAMALQEARVAQVNADNYALLYRDPIALLVAGDLIACGLIA